MQKQIKTRLILGTVLATQFAFFIPVTALAETSVNATVCGGDSQASVTISTPETDSTIEATTFKVSGTVRHASSLTVNLDSQYDQTVAIGAGQEQYEFILSTDVDTHTMQITAYSICEDLSATVTAIFTITPPKESDEEPGTISPNATEAASPQPEFIGDSNDGNFTENKLAPEEVRLKTQTNIPSLSDNNGMISSLEEVTSGVVRPIDVLAAPFSSVTAKKTIEFAKAALFIVSFSVLLFSELTTRFVSLRLLHINRFTTVSTALIGLIIGLTASV